MLVLPLQLYCSSLKIEDLSPIMPYIFIINVDGTLSFLKYCYPLHAKKKAIVILSSLTRFIQKNTYIYDTNYKKKYD